MQAIGFSAIFVLALYSGHAYAETISCPASVAAQENLTGVPDGWQAFQARDTHPLVNVSLSDGMPSRKATLVPTSDHRQGKTDITTWVFSGSNDGYWLSCLYAGTGMAVTRRLPADVKTCRIESDARFDPPVPTKIECH